MQIGFFLARYLPMPKLMRLEWQRRLTDAAYDKEIKKAQGVGDVQSIEMYKENSYMELSLIDEEIVAITSRALVDSARKFDLPLPAMRDEHGRVNPDWEEGQYGFRWTLSEVGRIKVREEVRKEKKARHEVRVRWLAWVTPLIGLAGIIATLLTRK